MSLEQEIKKLEKEKNIALERQDPIDYYSSCSQLGIKEGNLEDNDLFELGASLVINRNSKEKSEANAEYYLRFLKEVYILNINFQDFSKQIGTKDGLLIKYFPKRFGKDGIQNLDKYKSEQRGAIFYDIVNYAKSLKI